MRGNGEIKFDEPQKMVVSEIEHLTPIGAAGSAGKM